LGPRNRVHCERSEIAVGAAGLSGGDAPPPAKPKSPSTMIAATRTEVVVFTAG